MTRKNFTCKVVTELLEDDFSITIKNTKSIDGCSGWFDRSNKEFFLASRSKMAFETMVHEYSHYLQWKNRKRYFNKLIKGNDIFFSWVEGQFFTKQVVEDALSDVIELEWDCECQALDIIKKNNLDIDINDYCRAANAYLGFYHTVHSERKWTKNKSPYNNTICKMMDSCLHPLDYYLNRDNISEKQEREYLKTLNK